MLHTEKSSTTRSSNKMFLLTDIGSEWAEKRMTTSLLFSGGKQSSSFRMWSAKHCGNAGKGGSGASGKNKVEGKDNIFKMRATPKMSEQPSKPGTLFLKNCKQYDLSCFGSSSKWLLTGSGAWGI